jgi:hypothetical protein
MKPPTNITNGTAAEWRREREAAECGQAKPFDRKAHARELWRNAKTYELRAHLRKIYPGLFAPRREAMLGPEPEPDVPQGFSDWTLAQQEAWFEAHKRYSEARP